MREPMEFESLAHLSRWRRLVIWFCEDPVGRNIAGVVAGLLLFSPVYFFKWWGLALVAALLIGFVAGYRLARSFATSGQIPPEV